MVELLSFVHTFLGCGWPRVRVGLLGRGETEETVPWTGGLFLSDVCSGFGSRRRSLLYAVCKWKCVLLFWWLAGRLVLESISQAGFDGCYARLFIVRR